MPSQSPQLWIILCDFTIYVYYIHYVTLPFCRPPYFDNKNFLPPHHIHLVLCHSNQSCFHVGYRQRKVHNSEHSVTKNMHHVNEGKASPFCTLLHVCDTPLSTLQPQHSWILNHSICSSQQGSYYHLREARVM